MNQPVFWAIRFQNFQKKPLRNFENFVQILTLDFAPLGGCASWLQKTFPLLQSTSKAENLRFYKDLKAMPFSPFFKRLFIHQGCMFKAYYHQT